MRTHSTNCSTSRFAQIHVGHLLKERRISHTRRRSAGPFKFTPRRSRSHQISSSSKLMKRFTRCDDGESPSTQRWNWIRVFPPTPVRWNDANGNTHACHACDASPSITTFAGFTLFITSAKSAMDWKLLAAPDISFTKLVASRRIFTLLVILYASATDPFHGLSIHTNSSSSKPNQKIQSYNATTSRFLKLRKK